MSHRQLRDSSANASIKPFAGPPERSPRVLFVGDHFGHPGGVVHGVTTYYRTVLPGLARHGVAATLCLLGPGHPAAAALATNHVAPIFFNRSKWDPRALLDLGRLVRKLDGDILHLSNIKAISLGCFLARRAGVATVLHFHDRVPPPAPLLPVMRHFARQADAAIAISESVRAFVATTYGLPPAQIAVLHYGLDLAAARSPSAAERAAQRVRLGLAAAAPVIAIVGRIAPEKRQALLIRTMPAVLQARPDAVLLVVGDGPERLACEAEARRLGLDAAVRFLGQRSDVADVLAATDMLALTSTCEPFGYVVIEAAAAAVPTVAFATGGVPEIVRHEVTGLLVPQDDTEMLAAALIRLVRDPELARRLGAAAQQEVRRFDLEAHLAALAALYHQVLAVASKRDSVRIAG
jgi:glycosyltransferase involved in cell wall biosynthesis